MNTGIRGRVIKASYSSNEKNSFVSRCEFFLRKLEEALQMRLEDEVRKRLSVCGEAEGHISKGSLENHLNF